MAENVCCVIGPHAERSAYVIVCLLYWTSNKVSRLPAGTGEVAF